MSNPPKTIEVRICNLCGAELPDFNNALFAHWPKDDWNSDRLCQGAVETYVYQLVEEIL